VWLADSQVMFRA